MKKTKIELQFEQLEALAKEWRAFSKENRGWSTEYYGYSERVRCYFAENSDHTAVDFELDGKTVGFAFFSSTKVEVYLVSLGKLQQYIDKFTELLGQCRAEMEERSEKEVEAAKKARAETLKRELAELEQPEV